MGLLKKKLNDEDDDFSIDRFALELEAERNPGLLRKYGKKLSIATGKVKDTKRNLEFLKSEYAERIRANPKAYGLKANGKISDATVFPLTFQFDEVKKAHDEYVKWIEKEADYASAVNTCQQRGSMIKELVKLHLNQYYAKISVSDDEVKGKDKLRLRLKSK